jgi:hypothetical protein
MTTISSVTGTLTQGSTATITGSGGFNASQGNSVLLFGTVGGAVVVVTPSSWSDTVIQAPIPANADLGNPNLPSPATSYFSVLIAIPVTGSQTGVRSPPFQTLPAAPTPGQYPNGTYIIGRPGASGS